MLLTSPMTIFMFHWRVDKRQSSGLVGVTSRLEKAIFVAEEMELDPSEWEGSM